MLNRINATIIFFTRLPLWRVANPPAECYRRVVELWPLAGWITGGVTAATLWVCAQGLPLTVAVVMALCVRALLTGGLHEDGLADWWDAFGAGGGRERTLAIMKDSHTGTYGVMALLFYYLLITSSLAAMPLSVACGTVFAADVWSKCCASQIINRLPYARTEQTAKNHTVYAPMPPGWRVANLLLGLAGLPALPLQLWPALVAPVAVTALTVSVMRRRLGGYTGDCCGATALMSELAMILTTLLINNLWLHLF